MKTINTLRLVKQEDLNHHGTLYAGRLTEWFVENSFICAAKATGSPERLVCRGILDFSVMRPTRCGALIDFSSKVVRLGQTNLIVHCSIVDMAGTCIAEGFISFVYLDEYGKPSPHLISLDDTSEQEEIAIREAAENLFLSRIVKHG